jgi:hypothetical protein
MTIDLSRLPAWPQSQEPLADQMADLISVANRLGLHDAADAVKQMAENIGELRYGCHVDLEPGMFPTSCVIDTGDFDDCNLAHKGMRKEQCKYWKIDTTRPTPAGEAP